MHLQTRELSESLQPRLIEPPRDAPGVLVVDDDHQVRILLQLGLERSGFNVWVATSGWEAVELYREHMDDIALALLDVCVPGMDGPATMRALRSLNPQILVCFMSGGTGDYDVGDLRELGAECVIAKPFRLSELTEQLRQFTNGATGGLHEVDSRS